MKVEKFIDQAIEYGFPESDTMTIIRAPDKDKVYCMVYDADNDDYTLFIITVQVGKIEVVE